MSFILSSLYPSSSCVCLSRSGRREGETEQVSQCEDERRETTWSQVIGGSNNITDGASRDAQQPGGFLKHTHALFHGRSSKPLTTEVCVRERDVPSSTLLYDIYNKMSFMNVYLCFVFNDIPQCLVPFGTICTHGLQHKRKHHKCASL